MPAHTDFTNTPDYVIVVSTSQSLDPSDGLTEFKTKFGLYKRSTLADPSTQIISYGKEMAG